MADYIHWPTNLLRPAKTTASPVAFTRSGGRSLGGIERTTRTDKGYWRISLSDITLWSPEMRRTWNAIRTQLNGRAGVLAVPAWSFDSAPYASGQREATILSPHDDGSTFNDGTEYQQGAIDIEMASFAPLGSTVATLKLVNASGVSGIRFSYQHALYETGAIISEIDDDKFQVSIFPAIRQAIPARASLECDAPTCLVHLSDDRGMDIDLSAGAIDAASVDFAEAVDYWNDLALEAA